MFLFSVLVHYLMMSFLGRSEINPDNMYHQPQAAKQLDLMLRALQDVSDSVVAVCAMCLFVFKGIC